jgi:hypothetical protein
VNEPVGLETGDVVRATAEAHVALSKGNYRRMITEDQRFKDALEAKGIVETLSETLRGANGHRLMVYRRAVPKEQVILAL